MAIVALDGQGGEFGGEWERYGLGWELADSCQEFEAQLDAGTEPDALTGTESESWGEVLDAYWVGHELVEACQEGDVQAT